MKNKVIIIGNDHANTLGVIRTFGENGIKPYVIIINESKLVGVIKSKYVEKYWICPSEEIAILTMISEFGKESLKPVVFPTSDSAALKIDEQVDRLKNSFIVPNIDMKTGKIAEYMDKYKQFELAKENNIKAAKSYVYDFMNNKEIKLQFPWILKPVVSAKGCKDDISICQSFEEFDNQKTILRNKGYNKILIQEFIDYSEEIDIAGYAYKGMVYIPAYVKKIRIWPEKKGSTTYGEIRNKNEISPVIEDIQKLFKNTNYNGIFDIDIFIDNKNNYWLNEINFRNGALSYAYGKACICYYWYLCNINNQFITPSKDFGYYFIEDHADFHNVVNKIISYSKYKENKKKSRIKLIYNNLDRATSKYMLLYKLLKKIKIYSLINYMGKIYHNDLEGIILSKEIPKKKNFDYDKRFSIHPWSIEEYEKLYGKKTSEYKEYKYNLKKKRAEGVVLKKEGITIGHAIIKSKKAKDRFFKIKKSNVIVLSSIFIEEKYRGHNFQKDLIDMILTLYRHNYDKVYAFIYKYNVPSIKNFYKDGFKYDKSIIIRRFLKKSINRENI